MTLPIYLAMTEAEIHSVSPLPPQIGYMACHFSPYGTGLCNLPKELPAGSLLIINDRIPVSEHDPEEILAQTSALLQEIAVSAILLDLQRKDYPRSAVIAETLVENLPVPVGVSTHYAKDLNCPVFLPLPEHHVPLAQHLKPWEGRQVWLDLALSATCYRVDHSGCTQSPCCRSEGPFPHQDTQLHCHYTIRTEDDAVTFILHRTAEDLHDLLNEAEQLGISTAIGLYQEFEHKKRLLP